MIRILILVAMAAAAFGQMRQNRIELIPAPDNLTSGALDFRALRPSTYRVRIAGPDTLAGDVDFKIPAAYPLVSGQCVKGNTSGVWTWGDCGGSVTVSPADYDWSQVITATGTAGTKTITLTPGPLGVDAADTLTQYALSGTPGAAELVTSTGAGDCDGSGQPSCTVEVVTSETHAGATTMGSSTNGISEAIMSQASGSRVEVALSATVGGYTPKGTVYTQGRSVHIKGAGWTGAGGGTLVTLQTPGQVGFYHQDGVFEFTGVRLYGTGDSTGIVVRSTAPNGSQTFIRHSWFENHATNVNIRTASDTYIEHNLFRPSDVCLEVGNELWADQGGLYIHRNYFGCTDKNIFLHGMGNTTISRNSFLGSDYSIDADFRMVVVDTSGTTVTATGDYLFGTQLTTGQGVFINGTQYEVATRDSATQLTLTTSAGTQSGVDLGVGTGQLQIQNNNMDNQGAASIRLGGTSKFVNIDISGNHIQRVSDTQGWKAVEMTNPNLGEVTFQGNTVDNFSTINNDTYGLYATATGPNFAARANTITGMTYGMYLDLDGSVDNGQQLSANTFDGIYVDPSNDVVAAITLKNGLGAQITDTLVRAHNRAIVIDGASTNAVRIGKVQSFCSTPTDCAVVEIIDGAHIDISGVYGQNPVDYGVIVGASATADSIRIANVHINHAGGVRISTAVAVLMDDREGVTHANLPASATDGSLVRCTDCQFGASGCASGGTGAIAERLNGAWSCRMGLESAQWLVSSGNAYRASGNVGIGIDPTSADLQVANTGQNNVLVSYGGTSHYSQWIQDNGYTSFGTYSSSDLLFGTDSTNRWRLTATGMLHPEADDQYDLGVLSGARIRGVYSKIVDTALAGGTGDYMRTRKLVLFDNTGSTTAAASWDFNVVMSGAGAGQNSNFYLRDNGGTNVFKAERIASGVAVDRTFWYTDLLPDANAGQNLGSSSYEWNLVYANQLGDNLNPVTVFGSNSEFSGINTQSLTINTGAATVGYVWTATSTGGAGSWQAATGGQWLTSGSNLYYTAGSVGVGGTPNVKLDTIVDDASTNTLLPVLGVSRSSSSTPADGMGGSINWILEDAGGSLIAVNKISSVWTTASAATRAARMDFYSALGNATAIAMSIDSAGNVGINDTTPSYKFEVNGTAGFVGLLTATGGFTAAANSYVTGGSSFIMDRASRTTNQKAYWTVAGSSATTGAWSTGTTPGGGQSRWVIDHNGTEHLVIDEGGLLTLSAGLTVTGSTSSVAFNATGSGPFKVSGTTVIDSSRNASFVGLTLNGEITGDLIPSTGNFYSNGTSSKYWSQIAGETIYVENGRIRPRTGSTGTVGISTARFATGYFVDLNLTGSITAPSGNTGYSGTISVRKGDDSAACNLVVSAGLITSTTC